MLSERIKQQEGPFRSASLGFSCPAKVWNFLNLDESATIGLYGSYYIQIGKIII
jgi:hypothetical protein